MDSHGLQTSRYTGGIGLDAASAAGVQLCYMYDLRKQSEGGPRHFLATVFTIRRGRREP